MQDCVTDWQSPVIPPTIRRPWRVFEEDLEEKVTSNASQVGQVDAKVREQIAAVQAKGARVAFLSLSETERQTYYQVALHELSAFVFWRRSQLARQKSGEILPTDMEAGWDLLDMNDKGEWLPQDPIAFLRADAQWATLLADVHGGDEQMVGTEDLQAVPTPMKSEILATTKAPVKKEPSAPAAAAPAPQPPVKKEPSAPASKPAGAPDAGVTKPPAATAQQEASAAAPTAAKASAKALKQEPAPPAKAEFPKKAAVEKETEQTVTGSKQPSSAVVPAPAAHEKKRKEAKPAPEATRRSRRENPDAETNGAAEKKAAAVEASRTGRATARKRAHEPHERAEATAKQQGARRFRGAEDAGPANLFPEALEAKCCVCNGSDASMDNDLAMCDRCDKAFHAKCHDPPVAYFGRPDDQWFCATCTRELAEMRELSLKVDDFCWVQCTGEAHPWPAQVVRIDFCSLADPRPYWVQYFDAGPPEGQWVGEVNVKAWTAGPRWGSIHQARRRNAVRLAEAAGAPALSTVMPAPSTPKRKPPAPLKEGDSPQSPERKRKRPAKEGTSGAPAARRSSRVQAMLDRKAPQGGQKVPTSRKAPRLRREPEKNDTEDDEFMQQATEMRSLIAAAKERQRKLEEELAQVANGKQMVATEAS